MSMGFHLAAVGTPLKMVSSITRGQNDDDVAQHGGHTTASSRTHILGLHRTSLILDIHFMVNRHLSKQGIC